MGVGISLLSDEKVGSQNFGGPLQFTILSGISYKFWSNLALGIWFHHFLDASIFDGSGLNLLLLTISYDVQ
ncbi:acyloxyacyl hydrolase [Desulfobacterota bacterium AH_259_B03_O07]|nr:acyloxyacyl hydrolase [Desulfobacterota bacterium AH_259_B03_O07]